MPWKDGTDGPTPFDPTAAVNGADTANPIFVNTADTPAEDWDKTRYVYTYVAVTDDNEDEWIVCVVQHAHYYAATDEWKPGNSFICGWENWEIQTSQAVVIVIAALTNRGTFPGADRYPRQVED